LTSQQLYSTASYQAQNLQGTGLELITLTGINLAGQNLANADLFASTLTNANLTNANLTNANLAGANLTNADFTGANLQSASFFDPNDFVTAALTGAIFDCADLRNATGINLNYTNSVNGTIYPDGTVRTLNLAAGQNLLIRSGTPSVVITTNGTIGVGASITANGQVTGQVLTNNGSFTVASGVTALNQIKGTGTITISGGTLQLASGGGISTAASLAIAPGGTLDLTNNDMIVHSVASGESVFGPVSAAGTIENEVATGRGSNGSWTGTGLISSAAAASPGTKALAVVLNDTNQSGTLSGTQLVTANTPFNNGLTTFDGQTVADGDVLVKFTCYGDALLTGSVTAADYIQIDNGFQNGLSGWYNGDFNYDGVINGDDYTLIDNAFNSQDSVNYSAVGTAGAPTDMIASDTDQVSAVPEPASISLLAIVAGSLLARRRRAASAR